MDIRNTRDNLLGRSSLYRLIRVRARQQVLQAHEWLQRQQSMRLDHVC